MRPFPLENEAPFDSIAARVAFFAATTPHSVAIVDSRGNVTYAELERKSNQLAAQLQHYGAAPEKCVAVYLERSAGFIISLLAVFKTGAAYVPIDPATPLERIAFMLADAAAVAMITEATHCSDVQPGPWKVLSLNEADGTTARPSHVVPSPESLAYVIYTSGSTGQPKGVEITHGNLANLIAWHQEQFEVTAVDRASHVASLGFDASVWEIWPYLTAGASVQVADECTRRSAELLRQWLIDRRITISFVPTILAEQMLQMPWPERTCLRAMLTGGDRLHRRPPPGVPFEVVNNYGPTECTVVATSGTVAASCDYDGVPPTIGRPIAGTQAIVLDANLRPVQPGEEGELCVAGACVGRGYRNLPELTAERFVTYLQAGGEPLRIYRTGDGVRMLESGEFEFLGRIDDQVKIRGYRIEPGEIEFWLNRCSGINASAIAVKHIQDYGPVLVAYVVPEALRNPAESDMRAFLAAHLPEYMVPEFFVTVPALPLTHNGKVDKSALPPPSSKQLFTDNVQARSKAEDDYALQQEITGLVAALLDRSSIAPDENFFMMGGHSMLGVQLVAQIRDRFGVRLTLRQLFTAPTVAALSAEVARLSR